MIWKLVLRFVASNPGFLVGVGVGVGLGVGVMCVVDLLRRYAMPLIAASAVMLAVVGVVYVILAM